MASRERVSGLAIVLLVAGLQGCVNREEIELKRARAAIAKSDGAAAVVHLKNVIAKEPKNAEARFLLGQQFLAQGDPVAAQVELQRAREFGHDPVKVVPLLARAMLASNQFGKLTETLGTVKLEAPEAAADLQSSLARALLRQGKLEGAQQATARALSLSPQSARAHLTDALVHAVTGETTQAREKVEAVLKATPGEDEAWQIKGDLLLRTEPDGTSALAAMRQALALNPRNVYASASIIALQLARNDPAAARQQFEQMRKIAPRHPQTGFYEALLAYEAGEYARARPIFQGLLKISPDNLVVLQWAGANELALNAPVQAEAYLGKVVALSAEAPMARQLLARTYLRMGQPAKASAVLAPLLAQPAPALTTLTLAGQAKLMSGDVKGADALFSRAARSKPDDPQIRVALALAELSKGNGEAALGSLAKLAAGEPSTQADLALISALIRRNDLAGALSAIDALDRKQPDQALAPQLRGQVQLMQRDPAAARKSFELAHQRKPDYYPAVAGLATLDVEANKLDDARRRFEEFLRLAPGNSQALMGLAEIAARSGAGRDEVTRLITAAVKADPKDASSWIRLIDHHLATLNVPAALSAAQSALAALPDHLNLLERLARVQLRLGEPRQAVVAYGKILAIDPRSVLGHTGMAAARLAAGDLDGAEKSVSSALGLAPELLQAQEVAVNIALKRRQPDRAIAIARTIQARHGNEAIGYTVEGEIEAMQGHWDAAATAFRKAVSKPKPAAAPARLHQMLLKAGKPAEADAFAERWTREQPKDAMFLFYLADAAQARKDLATAERRYREVLALQPQQAQTLNNLAMLALMQGQPGALALAEQAVKLAPDQPEFLDTLAQAQAAANDPVKALATQNGAVALSPDDPNLRLTLARLLVQAGDKPKAYAELRRLADLGPRFAQQSEVQSLLRAIGR